MRDNPWVERFQALLDAETIRNRATVTVPPLDGLMKMPVELAAMQLESALGTVFYPTSQCVSILQRLNGMAHAHCLTHYPDARTFLTGVYAKYAPLPDSCLPVCLTGLAGIGKTSLLQAFLRLQPADTEIQVDPRHTSFRVKKSWLISVRATSRPSELLARLAGGKENLHNLVEICRKVAYRDGIPMLAVDEFQFATGSSDANTRVTQMLLSLSYLGLPFLYAANFSLLYRLQKRPEEDQQRLLANPIILLPDPYESEDWMRTLASQQMVAPDVLAFDPNRDAKDLHFYTAGRKRAMKQLLMIAFRQEHKVGGIVDLAAIKRAYVSADFARYRIESEVLATQAINNRADKSRRDLWCPIPLPEGSAAQFMSAATQARAERVADEELRSALTKQERQSVASIEKASVKRTKVPGQVIPLKKNSPQTADELKQNAQWFRDSL